MVPDRNSSLAADVDCLLYVDRILLTWPLLRVAEGHYQHRYLDIDWIGIFCRVRNALLEPLDLNCAMH